MNPLILYNDPPTLGLLKIILNINVVILKHIRTPLVYLLFHIWFCLNGCNHTIWKISYF